MTCAADGGCSSAWLEPQIVDLVVAGSSPVSHPIPFFRSGFKVPSSEFKRRVVVPAPRRPPRGDRIISRRLTTPYVGCFGLWVGLDARQRVPTRFAPSVVFLRRGVRRLHDAVQRGLQLVAGGLLRAAYFVEIILGS